MVSSSAGPACSRRSLLALASLAGVALLVPGCTSDDGDDEPVTAAQVDSLADQVAVQRSLVAAYAAATAADAAVGKRVALLAEQAGSQLSRLEAASPGNASPSGSSSAAGSPSAAAAGPDALGWLRQQVTAAADSHAAACLEQSGARAALLGSIAAGLRGAAVRLD